MKLGLLLFSVIAIRVIESLEEIDDDNITAKSTSYTFNKGDSLDILLVEVLDTVRGDVKNFEQNMNDLTNKLIRVFMFIMIPIAILISTMIVSSVYMVYNVKRLYIRSRMIPLI